MFSPSKKLKVGWTIEEKDDVLSDLLLGKIEVDAGNIEEVINSYKVWHPKIEEQVERLAKEWMDPDSDGTGILTYNILSTKMAGEIKEEVDKGILDSIMALAANMKRK